MKGTKSVPRANPIDRFNGGPVKFSGASDALYERHLTFDQVASSRGRYSPQWH